MFSISVIVQNIDIWRWPKEDETWNQDEKAQSYANNMSIVQQLLSARLLVRVKVRKWKYVQCKNNCWWLIKPQILPHVWLGNLSLGALDMSWCSSRSRLCRFVLCVLGFRPCPRQRWCVQFAGNNQRQEIEPDMHQRCTANSQIYIIYLANLHCMAEFAGALGLNALVSHQWCALVNLPSWNEWLFLGACCCCFALQMTFAVSSNESVLF